MAFNIRAFVNGHKVLVTFVVLAALLVGWWNYAFPSATWRYKMTVTVETPEGIKTGSVVRETRAERHIRIGDCCSGSAGTAGEAIVVDLGKRGVLFGLTEELDPVSQLFPGYPAATREGMKHYQQLKGVKTSLPQPGYSIQFVTFKDISDPLTVEWVDINHLSASFGAGVTIKDFTLETTDDPMTDGVVYSYLPWLRTIGGGYLDGELDHYLKVPSNTLHRGHFRKGF